MQLTSKQKALIRKLANKQKVTFQIGIQGIHKKNIEAIKETFNNNEIVKIKVHREDINDREITNSVAIEISKKTEAIICGIIGTTIILYKKHKNSEKRIKL